MKAMILSSPVATDPTKKLSSANLWELATRLFLFKADRWKRRAQFYERHRDHFPRLATSRFIHRCRELEATYRRFVAIMFRMALHEQLVPARTSALRKNQGQKAGLPHRLAALANR